MAHFVLASHRGEGRQVLSALLMVWHLNQKLVLRDVQPSPSSSSSEDVPEQLRLECGRAPALLPARLPCLCLGTGVLPGPLSMALTHSPPP